MDGEEHTIADLVGHDRALLLQALLERLDDFADNARLLLSFLIRSVQRLDVRKQTRNALAERVQEVGGSAGAELSRSGRQKREDETGNRERAGVLGLQVEQNRDGVLARSIVLGVW